jgi:hypothetical protein
MIKREIPAEMKARMEELDKLKDVEEQNKTEASSS